MVVFEMPGEGGRRRVHRPINVGSGGGTDVVDALTGRGTRAARSVRPWVWHPGTSGKSTNQ